MSHSAIIRSSRRPRIRRITYSPYPSPSRGGYKVADGELVEAAVPAGCTTISQSIPDALEWTTPAVGLHALGVALFAPKTGRDSTSRTSGIRRPGRSGRRRSDGEGPALSVAAMGSTAPVACLLPRPSAPSSCLREVLRRPPSPRRRAESVVLPKRDTRSTADQGLGGGRRRGQRHAGDCGTAGRRARPAGVAYLPARPDGRASREHGAAAAPSGASTA